MEGTLDLTLVELESLLEGAPSCDTVHRHDVHGIPLGPCTVDAVIGIYAPCFGDRGRGCSAVREVLDRVFTGDRVCAKCRRPFAECFRWWEL